MGIRRVTIANHLLTSTMVPTSLTRARPPGVHISPTRIIRRFTVMRRKCRSDSIQGAAMYAELLQLHPNDDTMQEAPELQFSFRISLHRLTVSRAFIGRR